MYEIKEYKQQDGTDILSVSPYGVSDERACTLINAEKYDVLNKFIDKGVGVITWTDLKMSMG